VTSPAPYRFRAATRRVAPLPGVRTASQIVKSQAAMGSIVADRARVPIAVCDGVLPSARRVQPDPDLLREAARVIGESKNSVIVVRQSAAAAPEAQLRHRGNRTTAYTVNFRIALIGCLAMLTLLATNGVRPTTGLARSVMQFIVRV
jgi:hypothetical protein